MLSHMMLYSVRGRGLSAPPRGKKKPLDTPRKRPYMDVPVAFLRHPPREHGPTASSERRIIVQDLLLTFTHPSGQTYTHPHKQINHTYIPTLPLLTSNFHHTVTHFLIHSDTYISTHTLSLLSVRGQLTPGIYSS